MLNVWSSNKKVNIIIELLLFFMGMNIFHYGQVILPLICLIILIDNKFKFYLKDIKAFTVLCIFSICFFAFSYKLGFYSVMGFCFPMAYYIGSNIKIKKEEAIKRVIYILSLGMIVHYLLNFIYELSLFGWHRTVTKSTRYDIWLQGPFVSTGTATNSVILLSSIYYIIFKEKNKCYKYVGIILAIPTIFYTFVLRRRTQIGILFIAFIISLVVDLFVYNNANKKKVVKKIFVFTVIIFSILIIMYLTNFLNFKNYIDVNSVIAFTKKEGLNSGRLEIFISGLKYVPVYLWGGQQISIIVGNPFHDLLFNIYDYAGLIPSLLMILYLILCVINIIKLIKKNGIDKNFKLLVIEIVIGYSVMFFLEPLMTGSSLFLIVGIIMMTCFESLV